MNEGDVPATNDEYEDIYKDIGDFRYDRELTKLEESNKVYAEDIARLTKRIDELTERNEALQRVNEILSVNISILLKTAKAEIDRKQLVIDDYRNKIEALNTRYGRNVGNNSKGSESFKKSTDEEVQGHCKMSEVEDGEIVGDCEVKKPKTDAGIRDGSNSRDRGYHSGSYRKRHGSHERSKGKSNDTYSSRRKSRYPDDNYSRHSSLSRHHHRSTSPDTRSHSDYRSRSGDKVRHSSRSSHSQSSRHRKKETSPHSKEQPSRKSSRFDKKTDSEKMRKDGSTDRCREERSNNPDGNKNRVAKVSETKKERKEAQNEENRSAVKTLSVDEYLRRKSADGSGQKKSKCDSLERQSVLADLYDEPGSFKTFAEVPKDVGEDEKSPALPEKENEEDDGCDWSRSNSRSEWKNSYVAKGPRTLYSRRMEAKFQQLQLAEDGLSQKCLEGPRGKRKDKETHFEAHEKPKEDAYIDVQVEKTATIVSEKQDGETENNDVKRGNEETSADHTPEERILQSSHKSTEVNPDPSWGESFLKKLLNLQKTEEKVGINEFSPLKNKYKLSKISPIKPVSKQHILEYYNLKPSPQLLTNIEPEVLDFSVALPETPGKNFLNSFFPLNENIEVSDSKEKFTANSPEEENPTTVTGKSGVENGTDDLTMVMKPKTKKRSCKTAKIAGETPSEPKKSVTKYEQEKSYKTRYHIRTRSKAESDKINYDEKEGVRKCKNVVEEESRLKRERKLTLSDEVDLGLTPKRMKCETPKTENETSIEVTAEGTVPDDITSFEVFRSVSDENVGSLSTLVQEVTRVEEKSSVDCLPSLNDFTANKTVSDGDESTQDKEKPSLLPAANSSDSSHFKVLRSYLMLSANDDSDDSDSSTGSGEYSDSGASALVDLL